MSRGRKRVRTLVVIATTLVLVGVVAFPAAAKGRVRATLTRTIPSYKSGGEHVTVAWKLRDASGHLVSLKHVFVKITCPTGDSTTIAYASPRADGTYRISAVVPNGGIGTVAIGRGSTSFPITNPFHR